MGVGGTASIRPSVVRGDRILFARFDASHRLVERPRVAPCVSPF